MKTIWKYTIPIADNPALKLAEGAHVQHVAASPEWSSLDIWVEVDPGADVVTRGFRVVGTGHPLTSVGRYIGTVHERGFVWHVYEEAVSDVRQNENDSQEEA